MDTINSTQRSGGVRALYRGYGVSAAAIGAYKALYFGLYDTACAAMEQVGPYTALGGEGGAAKQEALSRDGDRPVTLVALTYRAAYPAVGLSKPRSLVPSHALPV